MAKSIKPQDGSKSIISHEYNSVLIGQRVGDGYVNLTAMAKASGKLIADYLRLGTTKAFLEALSRSMGIPIDRLIITVSTGPNSGRGTMGHPQVAIHCGQWCSADFAVIVTGWVTTWMTTGQTPIQPSLERMRYRSVLKDQSRTGMTGQVKVYLEEIQRYDDQKYRGIYFAKVSDRINVLITGERSRDMKARLKEFLGREVKESDLIRDYFPSMELLYYIGMCNATTYNMVHRGMLPMDAVEEAAKIVLPPGYTPQPIDFEESVSIHRRLTGSN